MKDEGDQFISKSMLSHSVIYSKKIDYVMEDEPWFPSHIIQL